MQIGIIGLGKMGGRIAQKLSSGGHEVLVWNRSNAPLEELKTRNKQIKTFPEIKELVENLSTPRIIWIMVDHKGVSEVLDELKKYIVEGDIIVDGGNSNYKETDRRFEELEKKKIKFLGVGVSGGIVAFKKGYPMMVGGNKEGYDYLKPIFDSLSDPDGGYGYFGPGGAGHFVKMIHNGVEYAMMQAIGEGFEIMDKSKYELNLSKVAKVWQRGTIVSGFLMDRAAEMLKEDIKLEKYKGVIARSGEGDWTIEAAKELGIEPEIIDESVEFRKKSEESKKIQNSFTARMINALRMAFGGHVIQGRKSVDQKK